MCFSFDKGLDCCAQFLLSVCNNENIQKIPVIFRSLWLISIRRQEIVESSSLLSGKAGELYRESVVRSLISVREKTKECSSEIYQQIFQLMKVEHQPRIGHLDSHRF